MTRSLRDAVFVDGARTPFGKAGPQGMYAETRSDDMVVAVIRELLRRHPELPPERIDEVAIAATTQTGDQGLTIGRSAAILAGLPTSVPGFAIDRMCAGAMTAVTTVASGIAFGAYDVAIAGGVEHMGHHPMGQGIDPNPRLVSDQLVDPSAMVMGSTAENLHDRFPALTRERADAFAAASQQKLAKAYADGKVQPDLVPVATRSAEHGWGLATRDEPPRPGTTVEALAGLQPVFRPDGTVTAGNCCPLNDGAAAVLVMSREKADQLGVTPLARIVSTGLGALSPEIMGLGPVDASRQALERAGMTVDDVDLVEINEAFAAQVIPSYRELGIDIEKLNVNGGAIAVGHPFGMTGARITSTLLNSLQFHDKTFGLETMCVGGGQGMAMVVERLS